MNILLTNPQSLAPKIDEVRSVMLVERPDLGLLQRHGYEKLSVITKSVSQVTRLLERAAALTSTAEWVFILKTP